MQCSCAFTAPVARMCVLSTLLAGCGCTAYISMSGCCLSQLH